MARLELRNVTENAAVMVVPLDGDPFEFAVTNSAGKVIPCVGGPYDEIRAPLGELRLPADSIVQVPIGHTGAGIPKNRGAVLDLGDDYHWDFKREDKEIYHLQGKLTIKPTNGKHWAGTIHLPKVKIPKWEPDQPPAKKGDAPEGGKGEKEKPANDAKFDGPTLALSRTDPKQGQLQHFVFEGSGAGPIHRPGPEHFKLTRVSDGKEVFLSHSYDRSEQDDERGVGKVVREREKNVAAHYAYNSHFKGVRFQLDNGSYNPKETARKQGRLDLFGRAKLEPGVPYRLTWACWPVGAMKASEVSVEFELSR
jgi:hypothetical protein